MERGGNVGIEEEELVFGALVVEAVEKGCSGGDGASGWAGVEGTQLGQVRCPGTGGVEERWVDG